MRNEAVLKIKVNAHFLQVVHSVRIASLVFRRENFYIFALFNSAAHGMYPAQAAQAEYVLMLFYLLAKGARTLAKTLLKIDSLEDF